MKYKTSITYIPNKLKHNKIHQLQIIRGTKLENEYYQGGIHTYNVDEYIELLAKYIQHLRSNIIIDRFTSQSPKDLLIAPDWGLKITNLQISLSTI